MNIKELYNKIKKVVRTNPDYEVVDENSLAKLLDIRIDDENKEVVLEF